MLLKGGFLSIFSNKNPTRVSQAIQTRILGVGGRWWVVKEDRTPIAPGVFGVQQVQIINVSVNLVGFSVHPSHGIPPLRHVNKQMFLNKNAGILKNPKMF